VTKQPEIDTRDWWPCACVKGGGMRGGRMRPSTHIKLHAPKRRVCRVCGAKKPVPWPPVPSHETDR
jgi:hypothetical protein